MKKIMFLLVILCLQPFLLAAQTTEWDSDPAEIAGEGEYILTTVPAYFKIKTAIFFDFYRRDALVPSRIL